MNAAFINNARLLLKGFGIVSAFKICAISHWQGFDLIHSTDKSYFSSEQMCFEDKYLLMHIIVIIKSWFSHKGLQPK